MVFQFSHTATPFTASVRVNAYSSKIRYTEPTFPALFHTAESKGVMGCAHVCRSNTGMF